MLPFSIISTYGNTIKKVITGIRSTFSTSLIPEGRSYIQSTYDSVNNIGYVYGGYNDKGSLNDFWRFDLVTRAWARLSTGLISVHGGILWHDPITNQIYLYAGYSSVTGTYNSKMYVYNISTNSWSLYSSTAPTVNTFPSTITKANGVVYCWGSNGYNSLYSYTNGLWTALPSSTGNSISGGGMCTDVDYLYCCGSRWEKYNISTGIWSTMGSYGSGGVMIYNAYDNNIYCVDSSTCNMGLYNTVTDTWRTLYTNESLNIVNGVLFPRSDTNEMFYVFGYSYGTEYSTVQYLYN